MFRSSLVYFRIKISLFVSAGKSIFILQIEVIYFHEIEKVIIG